MRKKLIGNLQWKPNYSSKVVLCLRKSVQNKTGTESNKEEISSYQKLNFHQRSQRRMLRNSKYQIEWKNGLDPVWIHFELWNIHLKQNMILTVHLNVAIVISYLIWNSIWESIESLTSIFGINETRFLDWIRIQITPDQKS